MPTTINKQRLVTQVMSCLSKSKAPPELPGRPVLEQFIYAVCREGSTREAADNAFKSLQEQFFDWNEVRVSSVRELADALEGLSDAETRAQIGRASGRERVEVAVGAGSDKIDGDGT